MKKIVSLIVVVILISIISPNIYAQSYERKDKEFVMKPTRSSKSEPVNTGYTYTDSKGTYIIYISSTGSCFVKKISAKTGKEYRKYLGADISKDICNELGVEYKGKSK